MEQWYRQPATEWTQALPLGNGRLGAMVHGGIKKELYSLNEDSLWYGGPTERVNPDAYPNLEKIRSMLFEGRIAEAEKLSDIVLAGLPETQRHYEPLGELRIEFEGADEAEDYRRSLDIANGIARVSFRQGGKSCSRETFISYPSQVMAIKLSADEAFKMKACFWRQRSRYVDRVGAYDAKTVFMQGQTGGEGVRFFAAIRVIAKMPDVLGEYILADENEVVLLVAAATSFRYDDPEAEVKRILDAAEAKGYEALLAEHTADFKPYMDRVSLTLPEDKELADLPTDERLERVREGGEDNALMAMYYQFGRYLTLAGSRPGSLPLTLQGIWNDKFLPPWDSKYTININTEMNYWQAEAAALPECCEPLFSHLMRMRPRGRRVAWEMYRARGFVAHHNTDIWGDCAPQDRTTSASYWPMGAAWLSLHIWEHFQYGRDINFLKENYPTLREAAEFFIDFLIDDGAGHLVTSPTVSPENTYIVENGESGRLCYGPSMDSQILTELFSACIEAARILGVDAELSARFAELMAKLPPPSIGKHGQLMEWSRDYDEREPGHRHISHLFALHPGSRITPEETPELTAACRVTLDRRLSSGGGHTGWSRAWIINMWARLHDAENAYEHLLALLRKSTLPNLFDNHPPFQIDGNFGGGSGVNEMLMQSHNGVLRLLPALPSAWHSGSVTGLRARGGLTVDIQWESGKLMKASVTAKENGEYCISYGGNIQKLKLAAGVQTEING